MSCLQVVAQCFYHAQTALTLGHAVWAHCFMSTLGPP